MLLVGLPLLAFTWDSADPDAEILAWYGDSGNRWRQIIGAIVIAFAGMAFLWFIAELRARVRVRGDDQYSALMSAGAVIFVGVLYVGAAAIAAVSADVEFGDNDVPVNVDLVRVVESIGYGAILMFGGIAASLCMFCASRAAHRTGLFPTWLARVGYGAAALALFSLLFFPLVAIPLWALTVGVWSLWNRHSWRSLA